MAIYFNSLLFFHFSLTRNYIYDETGPLSSTEIFLIISTSALHQLFYYACHFTFSIFHYHLFLWSSFSLNHYFQNYSYSFWFISPLPYSPLVSFSCLLLTFRSIQLHCIIKVTHTVYLLTLSRNTPAIFPYFIYLHFILLFAPSFSYQQIFFFCKTYLKHYINEIELYEYLYELDVI